MRAEEERDRGGSERGDGNPGSSSRRGNESPSSAALGQAGRGRGGGSRVARRDLRMFANGTFINPLEIRISSQTPGGRRRQERNGLSFVDATHAK
jgi:hypothetical protein